MTLQQVADAINKLFRDYGLDHDVVEVQVLIMGMPSDSTIYLDPRENEPDPMKWRPRARFGPVEALVFANGTDTDAMDLLLHTFQEVFRGYFEAVPKSGQMRLF